VAVLLPLLLWLTGRVWLVDALDSVNGSGSRPVNFTLGVVCSAGWYTIPLIAVLIYRKQKREPKLYWPWWAFLCLGALALLTIPTRGGSPYNDGLATRVPGFTDGVLAGAIPLLLGGLFLWAGEAWGRLRRRRRSP
jgi:hypothetical protein